MIGLLEPCAFLRASSNDGSHRIAVSFTGGEGFFAEAVPPREEPASCDTGSCESRLLSGPVPLLAVDLPWSVQPSGMTVATPSNPATIRTCDRELRRKWFFITYALLFE